MKQHKLTDTQFLILTTAIVFGSFAGSIYFFGGWGMFIWFMFALAIASAGG